MAVKGEQQVSLERILAEIRREKGIDKLVIIDALKAALLTAARKKYGPKVDLEAQFNSDLGEIELFNFRTVVEKVRNDLKEIALEEARLLDAEVELGDSLGVKLETKDFGRIAAQTAKQVIIQKIRDAEGDNIYQDFKDRKGEVVAGSVHRFNKGNIIVNLGRTEALLPIAEQVLGETFRQGDRLKALIIDIRKSSRDPQVVLSRTSPQFLVKLFETEVPEITEGVVKVKGVARDPGLRSKIAVYSDDSDVDPVGACVGSKGSRVQGVVQELRGEKIDIIPWSDDPTKFVCNALAPAEISEVIIDETERSMEIIVEDDQLSLAIGKRGQNVRLAVKLTGWKIDIKSRSHVKELSRAAFKDLLAIPGIGSITAELLFNENYLSAQDIADVSVEDLAKISGIGEKKAQNIKKAVEEYLHQQEEESSTESPIADGKKK
ncbi:MAG: transcription termination factor NusA [Thermodesulfobacteriota bacterium]|jgi:N utilization substance protein A|nr:MAG: transcription termination factor NusA [Thermodesulfobacteriota bacterium]